MRTVLPRVLLVALFFVAVSAESQQGTTLPQYTWLRYLALPRDRPMELSAAGREPLDKLLAEKRITAWGVLVPVSRGDESWTHIVYVAVPAWSNFDGVTAAFDAAGLSGPAHHHDVVIRHVVQSQTATSPAPPKYLVVNTHPIIRGRDSDALSLFNEWAKPVFEKLTPAGKLGRWGLSTQSVVIDNKWTYMVWYFMTDLSVLDDVGAALTEVGMSKLGTYERRLREMSEDDYVGQLFRVVHSSR